MTLIRNSRSARDTFCSAAFLWVSLATTLAVSAAEPLGDAPSRYLGFTGRHRLLTSEAPPGLIGQARLAGRGPIAGYFQPVAITGPETTEFALAQNGAFVEPTQRLQAGLLIGGVYRFQITRIPGAEGAELYPTIEVIDRTYPPPGLATRYPIRIDLDKDDLESALDGRMVTRVIYLEDPQTAAPQVQTRATNRPIELRENQDALEVADRFGRPVAIVRIGSVAPPHAAELLPSFFFGYPAWAPIYEPPAPQGEFDSTHAEPLEARFDDSGNAWGEQP